VTEQQPEQHHEHAEVVAADVTETVEIDEDGAVVDIVETDVVEELLDDDDHVVEVVETHVVDTSVIEPDGTIVEVVETEVLDARLEGDEVVITDTVEVDLVEADLVDVDDAADGDAADDDAADDDSDDDDSDDDDSDDSDDDAEDADTDSRLEQLDDGSAAVAGAESLVGTPEALPFEMPARERFASLDDVEVTGDARVDAATARLEEVPDLPTTDHVGVYEDVHRRLQDALSDTEVR